MNTQEDMVNHPPHYNNHPTGVECIEIVEVMPYNVGNAMKYLWRHGLKKGTTAVMDLKKAAWYVNRELELIAANKAKAEAEAEAAALMEKRRIAREKRQAYRVKQRMEKHRHLEEMKLKRAKLRMKQKRATRRKKRK